MASDEILSKRLTRLLGWCERMNKVLDREEKQLDRMYTNTIAELETKKKNTLESIAIQEMEIKGHLEQLGREYTQNKYRMERDAAANKLDIERAKAEYELVQREKGTELTRLNEEKLTIQVSLDRQKQALNDLYEEKKRNLTVTRSKLTQNWQDSESRLKEYRTKYADEAAKLVEESNNRLKALKDQAESKKQGWETALVAIKRELDSLKDEKAHLERRVGEINGEKEKELQGAQLALRMAREQLEIDKATLIERAEEDQRKTEGEVDDLKKKIEAAEQDLHTLTANHEKIKKDTEESCQKEEAMLKEAVKVESDKRDYEQKLYEQEKKHKEQELVRLKEDYEKRKWQWDNQIRSLMLQKSVQDSEHEAERLRVDREARTSLRSLEAKRDELKQRLADVKNRHSSLQVNSKKEMDLLGQRWQWRRDRLWSLWQTRLDTLRKEREALHEQIEAVETASRKEEEKIRESQQRDVKRVENLEGYLMQSGEQQQGLRKQRQIQFELEKTRLFAQIKETETLVSDWMDRLRSAQEGISNDKKGLMDQLGVLDKWYQEEEKETQAFLDTLQYGIKTLSKVFEENISDAA